MQVRREDGYEIDTAVERLEVPTVHRWLSTDAYWALGRPAETFDAAVAGSDCYGVYAPGGAQVGFARVVTDHATFAWLCDVYIDRSARALGLGTWLAQTVTNHVRSGGVARLVLATRDAHTVYEKAGFAPLADSTRWMEIDLRPTAPRREVRDT
jgi:GNAT superfamily N-acetyltransferase